MKRIIAVLVLLIFCVAATAVAQDEAEQFKWTDEYCFSPPPGIPVIGMKRLGALSTNDPALKISYPETTLVIDNKLYAFDVHIEKLLIFDNDGKFIKTPFAKDQRIVNHVRNIDIDEKGRFLLPSYEEIAVFDHGKISKTKNYHGLADSVWHEGGILGFNSQMKERKNGLLLHTDMEGKALSRFGDYYNGDSPEGAAIGYGIRTIKRHKDKVYFIDSYINGFVVVDLKQKKTERKSFKLPVMIKRDQDTIKSLTYSAKNKLRIFRYFPSFRGISFLNDEIYLYLCDTKFLYVLVSDHDANVKRIYKGHKIFDSFVRNFAVTEKDGEPRFFITQTLPDGIGPDSEIAMYGVGGEIPTLENKNAYLAGLGDNLKKRLELEAKEKKESEEYTESRKEIRSVEDKAEQKEIALKWFRKNPENIGLFYHVLNYHRDCSAEEAKQALMVMNSLYNDIKSEAVLERFVPFALKASVMSGDDKSFQFYLSKMKLRESFHLYYIKDVVIAADDKEDWAKVEQLCTWVLGNFTEKVVNETAGRYDEAEKKKRIQEYRSEFLTYKGKALVNMAKPADALSALKEAETLSIKNYLGLHENQVDLYLAQALNLLDRKKEELEVLLPGALFSGDKEKEEYFRQSWVALNGEAGYEQYIWKQRDKLAQKLEDATFFTYDGKEVKLSSKFGKATLITFWTPDT